MADTILAMNAGSSSIKFALFPAGLETPSVLLRGQIAGIGREPKFSARDTAGEVVGGEDWPSGAPSYGEMITFLLEWITGEPSAGNLIAVGHRIVHGGAHFSRPIMTTPDVLDELEALVPLAPLHQPLGLAPIRVISKLQPDLFQACCFDTAFHQTLAPPVSRYAIPKALEGEGIRRYGFHGLSYEYIASRIEQTRPQVSSQRTVVAHLGSGASLCAMRHGRSMDTTMGFSALDGLVMATRPGSIDPGILIYLQRERGLSVDKLEHMLYHECGLLGVSGISGDVRDLLQSSQPEAHEALDLFAFRVAREAAAMASSLGGLECLVFTGGIGEHCPEIRAAIVSRLEWLGASLDHEANEAGREVLSTRDSKVLVLMMPTDEEATVASAIAALIAEREAQ